MRHWTVLLALAGCTSAPTAVEQKPLRQATVSPLHLAHTDFTSILPGITPIAYGPDYFYAASTTSSQGDGVANVTLPAGSTFFTGISARLYLHRAELSAGGGRARIVDVILWRRGTTLTPCDLWPNGSDEPPDDTVYCAVAALSAHVNDNGIGGDPEGWIVKTFSLSQPVQVGYTYQVVANLRGDVAPDQHLRVSWVDIDYTTGMPSPPLVERSLPPELLTRANLAVRSLMP